MADLSDGFFLVWNPGGQSPVRRHATRQSATTEAERLANLNPGEVFFVLAAITEVQRPPALLVRKLRHADADIPF